VTDSQRKAAKLADDLVNFMQTNERGVFCFSGGAEPYLAAALEAARVEERERCAKVADQAAQAHQRVGQTVSAKRFSALALHIRALSTEAPAPTEGEGEKRG
jgi:hypothetical protein